jgi:Sec-independent protein secretion pathway component TatC
MTYLLMGGPMVLLYEICILLARWIEPRDLLKQQD